ncbi:winged helix DNA-binding domain-containing protein [Bailinhaonella thermotolerans]|uniref:Winged helix DNA-binding domain-containing protein n=2 Tax=Bailinhaonella thermotolerans TaxID=1070861 RepID=A0A3A4ANS6_9ACTN|nr:winged helix DNA-binding domain-containing protein [Bailinhaonella thermotolerans]
MGRQGLLDPHPGSPADVVAAMCGAHAQVMSAGEASVALRMPGASRATVQEALWERGELVKTFGPRGTVHLLPARDLAVWTGALSSVPPARSPFPEEVRLTPERAEAVLAAMADALRDAELTVDELGEAVVAGAGPWAGDLVMPAFQTMWPRWRQAVDLAAARGILCFGRNRGRKVTYTSPARLIPGFAPAAGGEKELARMFLRAYGPAMPATFAWWLGVPRAWADSVFEALAGELERVEVEGVPGWVLAGDREFPAEPPRGVRLLPYFDAYAIASRPRERLFPGRAAERALARGQAGNYPVLLVDGVVAGVWHQRRAGRRIHVTAEPLDELSPAHLKELEAQVERLGEVLAGTPELTVGPVTVGPHA